MTQTTKDQDRKRDSKRDVVFAFGPNGNYFLSTHDPERCAYAFFVQKGSAKMLGNLPLTEEIFSVAIGADGGIFIACRSVDHKSPSWTYTGSTGLASAWNLVYERLWNKISAKNTSSLEDLRQINLTLGPGGSYFTTSKNGAVYRDIPTKLHDQIQEAASQKQPRQVSLGRHDSFVCLWDDDTISYSVNLAYSGLAERLQGYIDQGSELPAYVALNPYDTDSWFLVESSGQCFWSLEGMGKCEVNALREITLAYLQRRARVDGTSFTEITTSGNSKISTKVTPETTFDRASELQMGSWLNRFPEPIPRMMAMVREPLVGDRGRRNTVIFGGASVNIAVACKIRGMSLKSSMIAGGVAGAITLVAVKWVERSQ